MAGGTEGRIGRVREQGRQEAVLKNNLHRSLQVCFYPRLIKNKYNAPHSNSASSKVVLTGLKKQIKSVQTVRPQGAKVKPAVIQTLGNTSESLIYVGINGNSSKNYTGVILSSEADKYRYI